MQYSNKSFSEIEIDEFLEIQLKVTKSHNKKLFLNQQIRSYFKFQKGDAKR